MHVFRDGVLWRSAHHEAATDEDLAALDALGRAATLVSMRSGPALPGLPLMSTVEFKDVDGSPEKTP